MDANVRAGQGCGPVALAALRKAAERCQRERPAAMVGTLPDDDPRVVFERVNARYREDVAWLRDQGAVVCAMNVATKAAHGLPKARDLDPAPANYWTDPRVRKAAAASGISDKMLVVPATLPRPACVIDRDRCADGTKLEEVDIERVRREYAAMSAVLTDDGAASVPVPALQLPTSKRHREHDYFDINADVDVCEYGQGAHPWGDFRCAKGYVAVHGPDQMRRLVEWQREEEVARHPLPVEAAGRLHAAGKGNGAKGNGNGVRAGSSPGLACSHEDVAALVAARGGNHFRCDGLHARYVQAILDIDDTHGPTGETMKAAVARLLGAGTDLAAQAQAAREAAAQRWGADAQDAFDLIDRLVSAGPRPLDAVMDMARTELARTEHAPSQGRTGRRFNGAGGPAPSGPAPNVTEALCGEIAALVKHPSTRDREKGFREVCKHHADIRATFNAQRCAGAYADLYPEAQREALRSKGLAIARRVLDDAAKRRKREAREADRERRRNAQEMAIAAGMPDDAVTSEFALALAAVKAHGEHWRATPWAKETNRIWSRRHGWMPDSSGRILHAVSVIGEARWYVETRQGPKRAPARGGASATAKGAIELARRHVYAGADAWDRDDTLVGLPGARVVDLAAPDLATRAQKPGDLIYARAAVEPDWSGDVHDTRWYRDLTDCAAGGRDTADLWIALVAAGVARLNVIRAIGFLYGSTQSGKGTQADIARRLLGASEHRGYAGALDSRAICAEKIVNENLRHSQMANCVSARIVICNELRRGAELDSEYLHSLAGGADEIDARRLRRDPFSFIPMFKLVLQGNYLPKGITPALLERLRVIPILETRPKGDRDPHYAERTVADEGPIILGAILREAQRLQLDEKPELPMRSTAEREILKLAQEVGGEDVDRFVRICIARGGSDAFLPRDDVVGAFEGWLAENDGEPLTRGKLVRAVGDALHQRIKKCRHGEHRGKPGWFGRDLTAEGSLFAAKAATTRRRPGPGE